MWIRERSCRDGEGRCCAFRKNTVTDSIGKRMKKMKPLLRFGEGRRSCYREKLNRHFNSQP